MSLRQGVIASLLLCQSPAPWTAEGKKVAKKLALAMQYPEGYLEAIQQSAASSGEEESKGKGRKRKSNSEWLLGSFVSLVCSSRLLLLYCLPPTSHLLPWLCL